MQGLDTAKRVFHGLWSGVAGVHAVLIFGAQGSGKTTLANILAQSWLCKNPGSDGACGECRPCLAFENGNAIDLLRVVPEGASNWIRVHSIRSSKENDAPVSIQEFLRTLPIVSPNKVVLIESADRIYHEAFNSLLKMLEEPPKYGRFVLTTSQLSLVPATIRSRCMTVNTELPPNLVSEEAGLWERFCLVSPGERAHIDEHQSVYRRLVEFVEALEYLPVGAELKAGEELRSIAEEYAEKTGGAARVSQAKVLEALARGVSLAGIDPTACQRVLEAHRRILGNANAGIIFDGLMLELAWIVKQTPRQTA